MARRLTLPLLFAATALSPAAFAETVTASQLRGELVKYGAEAVEISYEDGHPMLTGDMLGQAFDVTLSDCDGPQPACRSIRYVSCREMADFSRIEALEIANTHNAGFKDTTAFAEEKWFGQVVCLRLQQEFRGEIQFGQRQVFEWQIELEDFLQEMDDARAAKQAAISLDNSAD
ncbi:hypothetical protein HAD_03970 [Hyphomonas adhaerens MHS-3]|uniref:YbjN domain-containing protein n=1 Tax=Hyphomonas adhaerens MHS-3 TaxID=1280949 RepID=A0A069E479_9PROT|nr:hypothetical protein [Hyphomonas adhaerens]KCZ84807.1 hypothetical protein HAD_03970 [Hyphomonas adhaerens MHS-3]